MSEKLQTPQSEVLKSNLELFANNKLPRLREIVKNQKNSNSQEFTVEVASLFNDFIKLLDEINQAAEANIDLSFLMLLNQAEDIEQAINALAGHFFPDGLRGVKAELKEKTSGELQEIVINVPQPLTDKEETPKQSSEPAPEKQPKEEQSKTEVLGLAIRTLNHQIGLLLRKDSITQKEFDDVRLKFLSIEDSIIDLDPADVSKMEASLNLVSRRIDRLKDLIKEEAPKPEEPEESESKTVDVAAFELKLQALRDLLKQVPRDRHSVTGSNFQSKLANIQKLIKEIETEKEKLEHQNLFRELPGKQGELINPIIKEALRQYNEAFSRARKIEEELENPPVSEMSYEEIVDEISAKGWDPFEWAATKTALGGRMKDLMQAYKDFAFEPLSPDPDEYQNNLEETLDRVVQKVRLQLITLDNKLIAETGTASVERGSLIEQLEARQFNRAEVMRASFYHPVWGEQTREIWEAIHDVASLRKDEKLVMRNGKKVRLFQELVRQVSGGVEKMVKVTEPLQPGDVLIAEHDPNFNYVALAGESGRTCLDNFMKTRFKDFHKMAKFFASKIFTSHDELTSILTALQVKTQTRAHNGGSKGLDFGMLQNPLAVVDHRMERYGGSTEDWTAWWLLYLEEIGITNEVGKALSEEQKLKAIKAFEAFYKRPLTEDEQLNWIQTVKKAKRDGFFEAYESEKIKVDGEIYKGKFYPSQYLSEKQQEIWLHQQVYFDIDHFAGKIPLLDFGETWFPGAASMYFLGKKEKIKVNGVILDSDFNIVVAPNQSKKTVISDLDLKNINNYETGQNGWSKVLETTFKDLAPELEYDQICAKLDEGGSGGLLRMWFGSIWGTAKMFPGRHMELVEVLSTHFIYRLFANYRGKGKDSERRLYNGILKAIEDSKSGGLASVASQLDNVVNHLKGKYWGEMSDNLRKWDTGHRDRQLKAWLDHWIEEEHDQRPPLNLGGFNLKISKTPEQTLYLKLLNHNPEYEIPRPLTRNGTLAQTKEK